MSTESPETVEEAIAALDKLFDDPKRWTKRALARDKNGTACFPQSKGAVCWCLSGGIYKVLEDTPARRRDQLQFKVWTFISTIIQILPTSFNDHPDTDFEKLKRSLKEWQVRATS